MDLDDVAAVVARRRDEADDGQAAAAEAQQDAEGVLGGHAAQLAVRLKQRLARKGAQRPTVIYGGTVSADNAGRFTAIDALDGVGATRGALDEDGFVAIVESVARADAAKRA